MSITTALLLGVVIAVWCWGYHRHLDAMDARRELANAMRGIDLQQHEIETLSTRLHERPARLPEDA